MPLRWHIAGRLLVARRWLLFGLVTFLLFQHTIWVFKRTPSRWEGPFMHPNLGFGCFPSIVKLCFRHLKEVFWCNSSFEHQNTCPWNSFIMEIVIFVVTCWLYKVRVLGVFAYCKQWSRINQRMRDDQIKINFSAFIPLIRHLKKHQTKSSVQTTLIKDTIYSLNG